MGVIGAFVAVNKVIAYGSSTTGDDGDAGDMMDKPGKYVRNRIRIAWWATVKLLSLDLCFS